MKGRERRRIAVENFALSSVDSINLTSIAMQDTVNFHSCRVSVAIEPQTAGANAKGVVVLHTIEKGQGGINPTITELNAERDLGQVWAIQFWAASNETPAHVLMAPKTSRNVPKDGSVGVTVSAHGITAGSVAYSVLLTGHERQI